MSAACPRYGFELRLRVEPGLDLATRESLADALEDALDARGLAAERVGEDVWTLVVTRDGSQAIDADREALLAWAATRDEIVDVEAGPLVDLTA
jgi:YggL 50S ribosome-binding protein